MADTNTYEASIEEVFALDYYVSPEVDAVPAEPEAFNGWAIYTLK